MRDFASPNRSPLFVTCLCLIWTLWTTDQLCAQSPERLGITDQKFNWALDDLKTEPEPPQFDSVERIAPNNSSLLRLRFQPRTWQVDAAFVFASKNGGLMKETLPGAQDDLGFINFAGLEVAATSFPIQDDAGDWGWGGSVRSLGNEETVTMTVTTNLLLSRPFQNIDGLISSGLFSSSETSIYETDFAEFRAHRIYRQPLGNGNRDWYFGLVGGINRDSISFRHSQSNSIDLFEIQPMISSETSPSDYQTSNFILGPSAGMSQDWRFWKRFQFGYTGSLGYLYNYSRHQSAFLTIALSINPELFPPAVDPSQPTVQPSVRFDSHETDHSFALLADGDIHLSLELFEHASIRAAVRQTFLGNQKTVLPSANTNTEFTSIELLALLSY